MNREELEQLVLELQRRVQRLEQGLFGKPLPFPKDSE